MERNHYAKRQNTGYNQERSGGYGNRGSNRGMRGGGGRGGGRGGYQGDRSSYNDKSGGYSQRGERYGGESRRDNYDQHDRRPQTAYGGGGGGGGHGFANKPSKSLVAMSPNPEEAKSQKVVFVTNQFSLKMGKNAPQIYQYAIGLIEDAECNAPPPTPFELGKIMDRETKKIETLVGKFLYSGYNIWTTQRIEQTYLLDVKNMGRKCKLSIDHESELTVNTDQDNQAMSQIMNVIVKQAMAETQLRQFGHRPRFFDSENPVNVAELNMQIWSGFKASACRYDNGCALIIDNCARFMTTKTVLDKIQELYDQTFESENAQSGDRSRLLDKFQDTCRRELTGASVIANYGNKKTYIVKDIKFDQGPTTTFFEMKDGSQVSVAKYFFKQYNLKITDKRQPMLIMAQGGRDISVPSEFCLQDGVPDSIRNNSRHMRTLLNQVKQNPAQKMESIVNMVQKLFNMKKWSEWDITVESKPLQLESRRLGAPELVHKEGDNKHLYCNERLLKQMPVFSADRLSKMTLFLVYDRRSESIQENVKRTLMQCQGQMGMKSGNIQSHMLPDVRGNWSRMRESIETFVQNLKSDGRSKDNRDYFAISLLNNQNDYTDVKRVFSSMNILSQCIQSFTAKKMNLSVASNIMKQINSKVGGESLRMKWPEFMHKENVMVIGIDVCHAGCKKSVVGFCATTNMQQTSYYSDMIIQPKNQELVKKDLDKCLIQAIKDFQKNVGQKPTKIIIYRDGVGAEMRDQIIEKEVGQFKEALKPLYNQIGGPPPITLVVVNKRINQRMFITGRDGKADNPQPGSIIDSQLIEYNNGTEQFDFYLVPQQTTQGCVTPVHYYVSMNESRDISRQALQDLTYGFCYMYSNWSGSIKVPAPCQYAHKIAEFHYLFDRGTIKSKNVDLKALNYNENFLSNMYYL